MYVNHCRFLKLELGGTDLGTGFDVFIIRCYCRNLSNFRIRIFQCSCVNPVLRSKKSSTLKELITKDKSVTLHNRSIQVFVNEMFKVKKHFYNYNR